MGNFNISQQAKLGNYPENRWKDDQLLCLTG